MTIYICDTCRKEYKLGVQQIDGVHCAVCDSVMYPINRKQKQQYWWKEEDENNIERSR